MQPDPNPPAAANADLNAPGTPPAAPQPAPVPAEPPRGVEAINLVIIRKCIPVTLQDVNGNVVKWNLNELTGAERDDWQQSMANRTKVENGKVVGGDIRGVQSSLLCRCLTKEDKTHPNEALLASFPCSSLDVLFERAVEMNRLDKDKLAEKKQG